jgi:hypothetical protein
MSKRTPRYLVVTVHTPFDSESTAHLQFYTFYAEHPDIAYELSMQFGRETRFGRRFHGLAHLDLTDHRVVRAWKVEPGGPEQFVVPKKRLEAFAKRRGFGARCDEALLKQRTTEPPFQMDLVDLDGTPWYELEHAYGSAFDVPKELRRLTSTDPSVQMGAIERLYGTIYHQGSIYPATVAAVLPLLQILANPIIENRAAVARLFKDITNSAVVASADIRAKWDSLAEFAHAVHRTPEQAAQKEVAERNAVREEINRRLSAISDLAIDRDPSVAVEFQQVVEILSRERIR